MLRTLPEKRTTIIRQHGLLGCRYFIRFMIPPAPVFAQGNDFMVPFSPDRPSAELANGSPEASRSRSTGVTAVTSEIAHVSAADVETGAANTVATPGPTGTPASTPSVSSAAAGVDGGGSGAVDAEMPGMTELEKFCFSDDDDTEGEEAPDKERDTIKPKGGSDGGVDDGRAEIERGDSRSKPASAVAGGADSIVKSAGGGGKGEGQKEQAHARRPRRQRTKDGGDSDGSEDLSSGSGSGSGRGDESESAAERRRRQDHLDVLLNPVGLPHDERNEGDGSDGNLTPPPGRRRGIVDSACATPAAGVWAAPDFGFSSDEDLDIELSSSEQSLERSVESSWSRSPSIDKEPSK